MFLKLIKIPLLLITICGVWPHSSIFLILSFLCCYSSTYIRERGVVLHNVSMPTRMLCFYRSSWKHSATPVNAPRLVGWWVLRLVLVALQIVVSPSMMTRQLAFFLQIFPALLSFWACAASWISSSKLMLYSSHLPFYFKYMHLISLETMILSSMSVLAFMQHLRQYFLLCILLLAIFCFCCWQSAIPCEWPEDDWNEVFHMEKNRLTSLFPVPWLFSRGKNSFFYIVVLPIYW